MANDETTVLFSLLGTTSEVESAFTPSFSPTDAGGEPSIHAAVQSAVIQAPSNPVAIRDDHAKLKAKTSTSATTNPASNSNASSGSNNNIFTLIIIGVFCVGFGGLVFLCACCIRRRRQKKQAMAVTPGPAAQQFDPHPYPQR